MTRSLTTAAVVTALDLCVGVRYCTKLIRKQIHPRLSTWLIFEVVVMMSLATYFSSHDHSIVKATLNLTDALVVTAILAALLARQAGNKLLFTGNELLCLIVACIALAAWILTGTAWIGLLGFQVVMIIAYVPTIESIWHWVPGRSPEPVETWGINAVAALLGVAVALNGRHDYLAMLYPLRAFILCMIVVGLVIRWQHKSAE